MLIISILDFVTNIVSSSYIDLSLVFGMKMNENIAPISEAIAPRKNTPLMFMILTRTGNALKLNCE